MSSIDIPKAVPLCALPLDMDRLSLLNVIQGFTESSSISAQFAFQLVKL